MKDFLKNKRIASKIFFYSLIFFYFPTIIAGFVFVTILRNEEYKTNKDYINNSVKIFEKIILNYVESFINESKNLAYDKNLINNISNKKYDLVDTHIYGISIRYKYDNIFIFDNKKNILSAIKTKNNIDKLSTQKDINSSICFIGNQIFLENIIKISSKEENCYLFVSKVVDKEQILNYFAGNIEFRIKEKGTDNTLFTTLEEGNTILLSKKSFFYINYDFQKIEQMSNNYIEVIIPHNLYRFRIDKFRFIITILVVLWILMTILFFIVINKSLVRPITEILKGTVKIALGDYSHRIDINMNNEVGKLADKINEMSLKLEKKEKMLNDINKNLERQVVERTKNLKKALEKLREYDNQKTDLFYSIVHDLKNPLTVISGYASLVIQYKELADNKKKDFMKKILSETERLTRMLNDFLKSIREEHNLSRMKFSKIDMSEILEYFYTIYEVQANEMMVDFVWDVESPLPAVRGNKEKIEHVVSNLLSNSFKFVNEKGMIVISSIIEGDFLRIGISDTGPGIEEGMEKEIFGKFKKLASNSEQSGAGLGLFIAQQIIDKHNGKIWVKNNKGGRGCTFYFTLPISRDDTTVIKK